ncbi:class I SAM-dependent methyltransferase [archaeon]|nr:class I SAM-dependent methyltransferase [archaeon]MBT6819936.1 class I SAM-dependent methyltransferase [archaeon]MBT6955856.1 class I SAM-dependent methyltransferase [archaeon]MBT7025492.1 class I SAM-dependent methyltransferase [archaeon]MBT7238455.1 class I SAM-dependent methyltransferase [archaeon]
MIYDGEYARTWIEFEESSAESEFRKVFLAPYFDKFINNLPYRAKVLDVGCGWGAMTKFARPSNEYWGVDPVKEFFPYIMEKYSSRGGRDFDINLRQGRLPNKLPVPDSYFDAVICSLALHTHPTLRSSVSALFSKAKPAGRVNIVDFSDDGSLFVANECFSEENTEMSNAYGIHGWGHLHAIGKNVRTSVYYHNEGDIEAAIEKCGKIQKKEMIGPLFVGYDCIRN